MKKRLIALLLTLAMLLSAAACKPATSIVQEPETAPDSPPAEQELQMQPAGALPAVGDVIHGFRVKELSSIDYLDADVALMEHEKSGAQLLYIANEDINRSFSVGFRTPAENDKGLPHVFEHAALGGSGKYPASNLFFEMINQTYKTYLNAATYPCNTIYPSASLSEEQLLKFVDYTMSGVLDPLVVTDERAMMREACRYELSDADAEIEVKGVVYNEMKGALTRIAMAQYNLKKLLFPGSNCSNVSGGIPSEIMTMSHQELREFHEKYYHPSNSLMVLYGKLDCERFLKLLDEEHLNRYDRKQVVIDDSGYAPVSGHVEERYEFPAEEGSAVEDNADICYGIPLSGCTVLDTFRAQILASYFLLESSPLQRLIRERMPVAMISCAVLRDAPEATLVFTATGVNESEKATFQTLVDDALALVSSEGIGQDIIDMVVNQYQFGQLLAPETSNNNVGISQTITYQWGLTGDANAYQSELDFLANIRSYVTPESLKAVVETYLVSPKASALAVTVSVPGLAERQNAELEKQLAGMKAAMSQEEIAALVEKTADFQTWTEENEKVNMIDAVKVVDSRNLPEEVVDHTVRETAQDGVRMITSPVEGSNLVCCRLKFDAGTIPFALLHDYMLLAGLLGAMDTENYGRAELQTELATLTYGASFSANAVRYEAGGYHPYLDVSWTSLADQIGEGYGIIEEILLRTDFSDYDLIRKTVGQLSMSSKMMMELLPDMMIESFADAALTEAGRYDLYTSGFAFIAYLDRVAAMNDGEMKETVERLEQVRSLLLNRNGLIVACAGSEESISASMDCAMEFAAGLDTAEHAQVSYDGELPVVPERMAIVLNGGVQYNLLAARTDDLVGELKGGLLALSQLTSDKVLLPILRYRNGAYGASASMDQQVTRVSSYRDPNLATTYEAFNEVGETLRGLELTEEDLDGYISSVYVNFAMPEGPLTGAGTAIDDYIIGRDRGSLYLQWMKEIKQFSVEDVKACADLYDKLAETGVRVTAGSAAEIEKNRDLFDVVYTDLVG